MKLKVNNDMIKQNKTQQELEPRTNNFWIKVNYIILPKLVKIWFNKLYCVTLFLFFVKITMSVWQPEDQYPGAEK